MSLIYKHLHEKVEYKNACGHTWKRFHASAVWEDQCVPIDVVLPSAREVNGRGRRRWHIKGWEESCVGGAR